MKQKMCSLFILITISNLNILQAKKISNPYKKCKLVLNDLVKFIEKGGSMIANSHDMDQAEFKLEQMQIKECTSKDGEQKHFKNLNFTLTCIYKQINFFLDFDVNVVVKIDTIDQVSDSNITFSRSLLNNMLSKKRPEKKEQIISRLIHLYMYCYKRIILYFMDIEACLKRNEIEITSDIKRSLHIYQQSIKRRKMNNDKTKSRGSTSKGNKKFLLFMMQSILTEKNIDIMINHKIISSDYTLLFSLICKKKSTGLTEICTNEFNISIMRYVLLKKNNILIFRWLDYVFFTRKQDKEILKIARKKFEILCNFILSDDIELDNISLNICVIRNILKRFKLYSDEKSLSLDDIKSIKKYIYTINTQLAQVIKKKVSRKNAISENTKPDMKSVTHTLKKKINEHFAIFTDESDSEYQIEAENQKLVKFLIKKIKKILLDNISSSTIQESIDFIFQNIRCGIKIYILSVVYKKGFNVLDRIAKKKSENSVKHMLQAFQTENIEFKIEKESKIHTKFYKEIEYPDFIKQSSDTFSNWDLPKTSSINKKITDDNIDVKHKFHVMSPKNNITEKYIEIISQINGDDKVTIKQILTDFMIQKEDYNNFLKHNIFDYKLLANKTKIKGKEIISYLDQNKSCSKINRKSSKIYSDLSCLPFCDLYSKLSKKHDFFNVDKTKVLTSFADIPEIRRIDLNTLCSEIEFDFKQFISRQHRANYKCLQKDTNCDFTNDAYEKKFSLQIKKLKAKLKKKVWICDNVHCSYSLVEDMKNLKEMSLFIIDCLLRNTIYLESVAFYKLGASTAFILFITSNNNTQKYQLLSYFSKIALQNVKYKTFFNSLLEVQNVFIDQIQGGNIQLRKYCCDFFNFFLKIDKNKPLPNESKLNDYLTIFSICDSLFTKISDSWVNLEICWNLYEVLTSIFDTLSIFVEDFKVYLIEGLNQQEKREILGFANLIKNVITLQNNINIFLENFD